MVSTLHKIENFHPDLVWSEKSIGRGCDRYSNVKGALVTRTLFQIDIESAGFNVPAVSLMMSLGPGQPRLDSGSPPSRLVSPARCCCGGFWAATHVPPAVRLRCLLSSFGSRWTVVQPICGNCRGRSSSPSRIMQIVTSTVRAKHVCEDVRVRCELSFVVFLATWSNGKGERLRKLTSAMESAIAQTAATASVEKTQRPSDVNRKPHPQTASIPIGKLNISNLHIDGKKSLKSSADACLCDSPLL